MDVLLIKRIHKHATIMLSLVLDTCLSTPSSFKFKLLQNRGEV